MAPLIEWTDEGTGRYRALDRPTAMRIFEGLHRYLLTGEGDVKKLQGKQIGKFRLRLGDYRAFFRPDGQILHILAVKNRREAYR